MTERDWLAERFEEHRTRLRAVAYRMLGSVSEADDAVQEAWLRLSRSDANAIDNLGGWLTTVVARVSLNMLRSRNVRREEPIGVRLPEPIVDRPDGTNPEHEALLADSVGLALLVVLETLSPPERLAFVLHDIFPCPSTRSHRSSTARLRRRANWLAEPADASRRRTPSPTPIWIRSARYSTPSWQPRAKVTSTDWSRCSTRTSC
jgi:RNA polymerase sigma-70 factor (ECF subfamily)